MDEWLFLRERPAERLPDESAYSEAGNEVRQFWDGCRHPGDRLSVCSACVVEDRDGIFLEEMDFTGYLRLQECPNTREEPTVDFRSIEIPDSDVDIHTDTPLRHSQPV
jgi:hypothetical protein